MDLSIDFYKGSFEVRVEVKIPTFFVFLFKNCGSPFKLHIAPTIIRTLKEYRTEDGKAVKTSLFQGLDLAADKSEKLTHETPYRQLIGTLLHLASTVRPDIAFALDYLSQSMHKSTKLLWKAVKNISRYMSGTKNPGIVYDVPKTNQSKLTAMPTGAANVQPKIPFLEQCLFIQVAQFPGAPSNSPQVHRLQKKVNSFHSSFLFAAYYGFENLQITSRKSCMQKLLPNSFMW